MCGGGSPTRRPVLSDTHVASLCSPSNMYVVSLYYIHLIFYILTRIKLAKQSAWNCVPQEAGPIYIRSYSPALCTSGRLYALACFEY